ncbi:MAG: type II toxin-antitoxin system RelE/ParE family toxin [Acidobacteria bacterium]|nr:type II toxin-antitoxin system RelE/ParE family toxin [Acidobacteriota bacterium]
MTHSVIISPKAENDFTEIVLELVELSPAKTEKFYFGCRKAMDSLATFPARCPLVPESKKLKRQVRHLLYEQYRIVFKIEDETDTVKIIRVRHQKRRPLTKDDL